MSSPPSPSALSASSDGSSQDVYTTNPYTNHPSLTSTESEVLWEYAKLSRRMKEITEIMRELTHEQDQAALIGQLRALEKKMGFVMTLFRASAWGVINERAAAEGQ
ncbi:DASH complex subunit Dad3-domain-containing protein [Schizophyllum amplum]|uniref:DASH complex subunit DAD3 n=1 Tax=Schizophyllum amplum TaxID=97359 RepID=A0A550C390_9AGAR|nr:DASH complex subunit Dad3-domain-containing protein [Auriculariopsis ampla]